MLREQVYLGLMASPLGPGEEPEWVSNLATDVAKRLGPLRPSWVRPLPTRTRRPSRRRKVILPNREVEVILFGLQPSDRDGFPDGKLAAAGAW